MLLLNANMEAVVEPKELARWTFKEETIYLEIMVEHVKKGNRPTTTFTPKAWNEIMCEFNKKTQSKYTKTQFKNKFNKMRAYYKEFKKLRDIPPGFGWDLSTKTVTAPNHVWENYIKVNPGAGQFRNKGCTNFELMDIVFGDTSTTVGGGAQASPLRLLDTDEGEGEPITGDTSNNIQDLDEDFELDEVGDHSHSRTPRKRDSSSSMLNMLLMAIGDIERERTRAKYSAHTDDIDSVGRATEILASLPDVPIEMYVKAGEKLTSNSAWREFFIKSPPERRRNMLDFL